MSKRRGQGEGSIYQMPDGRWRAAMSLGFVDKKWKRKVFTGKSRADVAKRLVEAQQARSEGLPVYDARQTVGQFLDHWLENTVRPLKRPKTVNSYEFAVEKHIRPQLGGIVLGKLTPQHVEKFLNAELAKGLAPITVQRLRDVLRNSLNHAVRFDLVPRNVAMRVTPPSAQRREVLALSPEQTRTLLEKAKGHHLEALFCVTISVGLRIGEVLGLRWQDIDFEEGTLTIAHQLQRIGADVQLREPKSSAARRTLPLPRFAIQALTDHRLRQQVHDRPAAKEKWVESGHVFTTSTGTPMDDSKVRKELRALLKDAGMPRIRFHDLRHSCASLMLAQGENPKVVADILGHTDIRLTLNTYSHVMPTLKREAADRLNALLTMPKPA